MKKLLLSVFALALTVSSFAQISTPAASPGAKITQAVGLTEIMVDSSRPAMKGRTIFAADGLVPFGKIWRTGANGATKITFGQDAKVGGVDVKAGDYAVLTVPTAKDWTFMLYPYEGSSWGSYTEKEATAKFMGTVTKTATTVESFTIGVNNIVDKGATIDFMWENTMVSVPVAFEVHELVMANIKKEGTCSCQTKCIRVP